MKSVFVDTSALVKYYYPETGSDKVEDIILHSDQVYLCQIAVTEMSSALAKKIRMKTLTAESQLNIWNAFQDDLATGQMELIALDDRHSFKAAEIIRNYGTKAEIRTLDSLRD